VPGHVPVTRGTRRETRPLSSVFSLSLCPRRSRHETGDSGDSREATRPEQHWNDTTKKLQNAKLRSASAPNLGRRMFHCRPPPTAAWGLHESRTESQARGPSGRRSCLALLAGAAQSCCAGGVVSEWLTSRQRGGNGAGSCLTLPCAHDSDDGLGVIKLQHEARRRHPVQQNIRRGGATSRHQARKLLNRQLLEQTVDLH
jgi:hypothetical protein